MAAWPLAARAQQPERMRRIGALLPATREDTEFQAWVGAFLQGLALAGWRIGGNIRIDTRHAGSNTADVRRYAAELGPDVLLAHGASTVEALLQATRSVPIVFVNVTSGGASGTLLLSFISPRAVCHGRRGVLGST